MAASSTFSMQGLSSGFLSQIQQQQAQRNAEQAEQQARFLQSQAHNAQSVAVRAQEKARSLKVQASQAQGDAARARQGLAAMKSLDDVATQLGGLHEQISAVLNPVADTATASTLTVQASTTPAAPVINGYGQATGTLVNVTA